MNVSHVIKYRSYRRRFARGVSMISVTKLFFFGLLFFIAFIFLLFLWYSKDLPEPGKIKRSSGYSTVIYDRNDKVIFEMYKDENRIPVKLSEMSPFLKKATISIEDKDFYRHSGFSLRGYLRAILSSLIKRRVEGGSTLTQQLVKTVLLSSERTFTRKIKEFVLASEIERRYSKDEILEMYLNKIPYGGTFVGIESAAKGYFGKSARELSLIESAILAGLPQRPSHYSPFIGKPDAYIDRALSVLRRMKEDKVISLSEYSKAREELKQIKFEHVYSSINAPHFVFYVVEQVSELFGKDIMDRGIKIKTTIDLDLQKKNENIVKTEIEKIKKYDATNGAVVVIDNETGEIISMVGSYDYNDKEFGSYNTATAFRQPGSAIKPITYATAFEKGYTASTVLMDVKTTFPNQGGKDYEPVNYDGLYHGPIQLRFALGNSINIPAVKLLAMVGVRNFLQKAYDFGLTGFEPTPANLKRFGLAITLGGGETTLLNLTSAYATIARGGIRRDYQSILEVTDYKNHKLYESKKSTDRQVISRDVAFLLSHILSDNNARSATFGTRSYLNIPGKTVAVKTGTTNDLRDNWTIGYTKAVSVGVWVGNNDNSPMNSKIASGVTGASPIWNQVMSLLLKDRSDGIIDKPDQVIAQEVDASFGGLPYLGSPTRSEYFIDGTQPKEPSPYYKRLKISKSSGKLANEIEIRLGDYDEKDFIVIEEADPVSTDGVNRWQKAIDEWSLAQPDGKYHAPRESSTAKADEISVQIKDPQDKSRTGNNLTLKARIASIDPVTKIEIFVNGSIIKTLTEDKKEIEENLTLSDGIYELRVRAENSKGKAGDSIVKIGVNTDWTAITPTVSP